MDQADIKTRLIDKGDLIARAIDPDHKDAELTAETLKISETSAVLRLTLGGKTAIAKIFADGDDARGAFTREHQALELLGKAPVPKLIFVSPEPQILVTSEINGTSLADILTDQNLLLKAEHIGQTIGLLSNVAPKQKANQTWGNYLAKYNSRLNKDIIKQQSPIFEKTPIGKLVLAHNDNALGNFILGTDRHLYVVDFENSLMKPEGWDLVTAARSIFRRFPEDLADISAALNRGYQLSARVCGLAENFDQIISSLVLADFLSDGRH